MCAKSKLRVTCAQCLKRFYTKVDFARHCVKVHGAKVTNEIAPSNDARTFRQGHVTSAHDKLLCGCAQCFGHFITKQDLAHHCVATHQTDLTSADSGRKQKPRQANSIPCFYCPKRFPSEAKRLEHDVNVHQPSGFSKCDFCAKLFLDANAKEEHMKMCQLASSPSFQQARSNNGLNHLSTEQQPGCGLTSDTGEVRTFKCAFCEIAFATKRRLKEHLLLWHAAQLGQPRVEYKCDFCPKLFNYPSNKYSHMRAFHKRQRPHVCEHCGQTFAYPSKKKLHVKRMHECGVCDAVFVYPAAKASHMRSVHAMHMTVKRKLAAKPESSYTRSWHPGTAKAKLDDGSFDLPRNGSCQIVAVRGLKRKAGTHRCLYCVKEFVSSANRRKHEKGVHHGILRFKCAFCEQTFRSSYHLKRHTNGVHRNERLLMCSSGQSQQEHGNCDQMLPNKPSGTKLDEPVELAVCSSDDQEPGSASNSSLRPSASSSTVKSIAHRINVDGNGISQIGTDVGLRSKDRRTYCCSFCPKQFADRSNRSKHERRMHKSIRTLPYPCAFCERMFRDRVHQRRHSWQSHRKALAPESKRLRTSRDCPPTFTNGASGHLSTKSTVAYKIVPGCSSSGLVAVEPTDARRQAQDNSFSVPPVPSFCSTYAASNSKLQLLSLASVLRSQPTIIRLSSKQRAATSWRSDTKFNGLGRKDESVALTSCSSVESGRQLLNSNKLRQPAKSIDRTVNLLYNGSSQIAASDDQKNSEESDRRCSFCAKLFASRKRKNRHQSNVHNKGTLRYKCGFCYKAFPDRYHHARHERFHREKQFRQPNSLRNSRSYPEPPISPDICSYLSNNSATDFTLLPEGCRYSPGVIASLSGRDQAEELGFASRVALSDSPNSVISDPGRLPSVSCGQCKSAVPFVTARKPAELETLGPAEPAAFVRICASGGSTFLIRRPDKPVTLRVVRSATRSAGQAAVNRVN